MSKQETTGKEYHSHSSRRDFLKGVAAMALSNPSFLGGRNGEPLPITERTPLVEGLSLSTVNASESFQQARGFGVKLNTQIHSEVDVQNRFDTAVLQMFNGMKASESLLENGELTSFIAQGNIPEGQELGQFAQQLKESDTFPITAMYYPDWAQSSSDGQWGLVDAKKGVNLYFVEEYGLFDLKWNGTTGMQTYGFTPRLTDEGGLQLDIYLLNETPPPGYPNAQNAPDISHTWIASNVMQIMMLSAGKKEVYVGNAIEQDEKLFAPPYAIDESIASNMSGLPTSSGNYFSLGIPNKSCLLDYYPLSS